MSARCVPLIALLPVLIVGVVAAQSRDTAAGAAAHRSVPAPGSYAYATLKPVPLFSVKLTDNFWKPRIDTSIEKGWFDLEAKFDKEGHFEPFRIIIEKRGVPSNKRPNNDEFVFKWMEAGGLYAGYQDCGPSCARIRADLDKAIDMVLAIRKPDGYINTYFANPNAVPFPSTPRPGPASPNAPPVTFGTQPFNPEGRYEFYNFGHMTQGAIALYRATGEQRYLNAAIKMADLMLSRFAAPNRLPYRLNRGSISQRTEHPNIEMALVELYRVTGDKRYLNFSRQFLDEYNYWSRWQIDGHAVMESLLNAGAVDLYLETGDKGQFATPTRLWEDMVKGRMYITGGIGSRRDGEAFGDKYELPNEAYAETCAQISAFFWSHRMLLATGEARYADLMERLMYNSVMSGLSLSGTEYFYRNVLVADGKPPQGPDQRLGPRQPWFTTPCCPPNVARFLASLADYFYATAPNGVAVNLYGASTAKIPIGGQTVRITQNTRYPWDGRISITVTPEKPAQFVLQLRVPGWAQGQPVPSDLYRYMNAAAEAVNVSINGQPYTGKPDKGFLAISREWKSGDVIELNMAMPVRRVLAHESVLNLRGQVALERGPIVYCVEGVDHGGTALNLVLSDDSVLQPEFSASLLGGVTVLRGPALAAEGAGARRVTLTAIPYAVWDNRGWTEMKVWLSREAPRPSRSGL